LTNMFAAKAYKFYAKAASLSVAAATIGLTYGNLTECDSSVYDIRVGNTLSRLSPYLKSMADSDVMTLRKETNGVWIFSPSDEDKHRANGGLPVARIATTTIKKSINDISNLWWNVNERKNWDSVNTEDSNVVKSLSVEEQLVYLQGKPKKGGVISSRDFSYNMFRLEGKNLGFASGSVLFVQISAPTEVPANKKSVRGDVNSILLLEPIDAGTTKVSYVIEMDVKGWLPVKVVNAAADETPLTLAVMRDHLER